MNTPVTLDTLATASAQDVFDTIVNHLRKRGERAFDENGTCCYRLNNLKCAAGCLIPDENYDPMYENIRWEALTEMSRVPSSHSSLIARLQDIHDEQLPIIWEEHFRYVAKIFNLNYTTP